MEAIIISSTYVPRPQTNVFLSTLHGRILSTCLNCGDFIHKKKSISIGALDNYHQRKLLGDDFLHWCNPIILKLKTIDLTNEFYQGEIIFEAGWLHTGISPSYVPEDHSASTLMAWMVRLPQSFHSIII